MDARYPPCPFVFELKWRKDFKLEEAFVASKRFLAFEKQLKDECPPDRTPVLVVKRNRGPLFAFVYGVDLRRLGGFYNNRFTILILDTFFRWVEDEVRNCSVLDG